jgi:hypothetical protein
MAEATGTDDELMARNQAAIQTSRYSDLFELKAVGYR